MKFAYRQQAASAKPRRITYPTVRARLCYETASDVIREVTGRAVPGEPGRYYAPLPCPCAGFVDVTSVDGASGVDDAGRPTKAALNRHQARCTPRASKAPAAQLPAPPSLDILQPSAAAGPCVVPWWPLVVSLGAAMGGALLP